MIGRPTWGVQVGLPGHPHPITHLDGPPPAAAARGALFPWEEVSGA